MCHFWCTFIFICGFLWALKSEVVDEYDNLVNLEVQSEYDLTDRFARVKNTIAFVNKNLAVVRTYKYIINESNLHYIEIYNTSEEKLDFKKITTSEGFTTYEVILDKDVLENQQYVLICKLIYLNKIVPAIKERTINEDQIMKFEGNLRFFSPYPTEFSEITYFLRNNTLVEVTQIPTYSTSDRIVYIFYNTTVFDNDLLELVFINNIPFLVVKQLQRTIDINHLGKITIQDEVTIQNIGPKFIGPYEVPSKAVASWLYTHLPASAENIEFFDILGNNSQTEIFHFYNYMTLKFKTRYPLLGGWKTSYILRYQVPIHEYLFVLENRYLLDIRSIDYVVDGQFIEDAVIKVVLPEGAFVKSLYLPEALYYKNKETGGCIAGLCLFGRKIIVLGGSNLIDVHIANVGIDYYLNPLFLIRAPLVISFYLQFVFTFVLFTRYILF